MSKARPSFAVIGAGIAGLSVAMRAAELGCEVTVIEREHLAAGSSGLSAGVYNINSTEALHVEVRVRARELLDLFEAENGLHLGRIGYMRLGKSDDHIKMFEDVIALQQELRVEPSRVLMPEEIIEIVPHMRIYDVVGAIYNPRDGHTDGPLVCGVLAERAQAAGATIQFKTKFLGLESGQTKRHRLRTDKGDVEADIVVNAAGPWADSVGEMIGAPLPLVNQRHEVIKVKLPDEISYTVPMVQEYIPGETEAGYFRQDGPGSMIAGMHTYAALDRLGSADPDNYDKAVEWETWEAVAEHVSGRLEVEGLGFETGWTGLYPISRDGEFVVGPYESDPTIIACGGLGGHGLVGGLGTGLAAAEWAIYGEPKSFEAARAFIPDRPSLLAGAAAS